MARFGPKIKTRLSLDILHFLQNVMSYLVD